MPEYFTIMFSCYCVVDSKHQVKFVSDDYQTAAEHAEKGDRVTFQEGIETALGEVVMTRTG